MAAREEKSDRKTRTKVTTSHDSKEVYRRKSPRLQTRPLRGELEKLVTPAKLNVESETTLAIATGLLSDFCGLPPMQSSMEE